jgi:hypothetical protein
MSNMRRILYEPHGIGGMLARFLQYLQYMLAPLPGLDEALPDMQTYLGRIESMQDISMANIFV